MSSETPERINVVIANGDIDFAATGRGQEFVHNDLFEAQAERIKRLEEALIQQSDNMAFILNRAALPDQWYKKFSRELYEARQALKEAEDAE
jgi:hypothetical protein